MNLSFFGRTKHSENQCYIHAGKFKETLDRCMSYESNLKFTNVHTGVYTEIQLRKGCWPKGKV